MLKKSVLFRISYLILCCCMILGLFPGLPVKALTEISSVEISNVSAPVSGAVPDFDVSVPGGAGYSVQSVAWTDSIGANVSSSHAFVSGEKYEIAITLKAEDDSVFKLDETGTPLVSSTVNGQSAGYCKAANGLDTNVYVVVHYSFPATEQSTPDQDAITHADINGLTTPVKGGKPDYTVTVLSSASYTVSEVAWKRWKTSQTESDSVAIGTREIFQNGYHYQVCITLRAKPDYYFATDAQGKPQVSGTINGQPSLPGSAVAGKSASQYVNIRYTFTMEAKLISDVVIEGVIDPVAGDRPNALADVAADSLYSVLNVTWECYDDTQQPAEYVTMSPYAIFAAGLDYRVNIYLKATEGAEFATDAEGNPTVTSTVNGKAATVKNYSEGMPAQNYICVTYTYPMVREEITQVDVSGIEEPAAGNKPDYEADLGEEVQYEVEKIIWEHLDTEATPAEFVKMDPNDKFENHQNYRVTVILKAKKGGKFFINEFDDLQVTGTINGEPTIPAEAVEKKSPEEYISIFYDFSLSSNAKTIKRVNLYDLEPPRPGEVPDFELNAETSAKYDIEEVIWEKLANRQSATAVSTLGENDVFQAGTYYRVKIILHAKEGYAFQTNLSGRPEVTATINSGAGQSAERATGKEPKEYICVSFVYGVYMVIDGDSGQWSPGDGDLKFRFSGKNKNIQVVHVGNTVLKKDKDYTAAEDSDIILLTEEYLDSLPNGTHTVTVEYTDGIVSADFEVSNSNVQGTTGEKSGNSWIWILPLAIAILCGMITVVIYIKRKENSKVYEEEYEEYDEDDEDDE